MDNEKSSAVKPPYVTYATFVNFIAGLRESGIPNRIDRSVLPGLSGNAQTFLIQALKFLGLITEGGAPTSDLKELIENKTPEAQKAILAKILRRSYGFLLNGGFNIAAATEAEVQEKFREKDLSGDTIRKAQSFFTLACAAADIPLSNHLKSKRGKGNGRTKRISRKPDQLPTPPPIAGDGIEDVSGNEKHTLYLDNTKKRKFIASAPLELTKAEYDRICAWLGVTLIVEKN